ncbi:MAG: nitrile hydratase accessory protein [Gammaproteobacteria bacterium]|nr:nitrile hydratase accessory protein [Gammaproteobacteria bacterium]
MTAERAFSEPWQAQAFALTLQLHAAGHFSWQEWSQYLAAAIRAEAAPGEPGNASYYRQWLSALETLLRDKRLVTTEERQQRQREWDHAARHTPHGQPVKLDDSQTGGT